MLMLAEKPICISISVDFALWLTVWSVFDVVVAELLFLVVVVEVIDVGWTDVEFVVGKDMFCLSVTDMLVSVVVIELVSFIIIHPLLDVNGVSVFDVVPDDVPTNDFVEVFWETISS